jgi:hypothetical protein
MVSCCALLLIGHQLNDLRAPWQLANDHWEYNERTICRLLHDVHIEPDQNHQYIDMYELFLENLQKCQEVAVLDSGL